MTLSSANARIARIDDLTSHDRLNEEDRSEIRSLLRQAEKEWALVEFKYQRALKDKQVLSSLLTKTSEDLKQALEVEKRFIASMSHEIRTPLNSIIGFIDLLKTKDLTDEQNVLLKNASLSADHLMSLISNVLDVSKIDAGQLEAREEEFSLEDVLMDCLVIVSTRVTQDVKLIHELPELDFFVVGDPVHIKQIFVNLLGNAAKFTERGYIKLSLDKFEEIDGVKVKFTIRLLDTGIGIPEPDIHRIFLPFVQAHKSKYGGTGLGLYLSSSLAKMMGGTIEVESVYGKGALFTIHMVLKRGGVKEKKFTFNDTTIVLAENDEQLCFDLNQKLLMNGASVLIPKFTRAADIINFCISTGTKANLMILNLDISPNLSSALVSLLKDAIPEMRILGITARDNFTRPHALDGMLRKPFTYYHLAELVNKLCSISDPLPTLSSYKDIKVLLAEDVDVNVELAEAMFDEYFSIHIDVARDGLEAVEKVTNSAYDIIFMDIQMPKMNGITATQTIREMGIKTPVAAITADVFSDSMEMARKAGMDDYVTKPIKKEQLERVLRRFAPPRNKAPLAFSESP